MLELLGTLIGAGSSLAGGIMGANAQEDAADKNYKVNLLNYYLRERERNDRIRQAGIERHDRQLGATDANGNRVHFVPGRGWVTELGETGKQINEAQNNEQMQRLLVDLPARRKQMFQNLADQNTDRYLAEGNMDAYKRSGELPENAGARYRTEYAKGTNANWDNIVNSVMRNAVRTGNSNTGRILTDLMAGRTNDQNAGQGRAFLQGQDQGTAADNSRRANFLNIANSFANRSRGMPATQYTPDKTTGNSDKLLGANQNLMADAGNQLTAAFGQKGGSMDYVEPQYGWGNAISSSGQVLGQGLSNLSSFYSGRRAGGNRGMSDIGPDTKDIW